MMKSIKVTYNIWGNYVGFIGTRREYTSKTKCDLIDWASELLLTGEYHLSTKSYITMEEITQWRADIVA